MFFRALFAFLVLPGVVAGLIPAVIVYRGGNFHDGSGVGFAIGSVGLSLLLWCVRDFFVSGKGTLAPWDPPKHLVVVGLYRFIRNPMYVAVLTTVLGWSVAFHSAWVGLYLVLLTIGFHLRVVLYEEPWLRRQFGAEWEAYLASVPRWLPRLKFGKGETSA
jgi:protein-S-isoprenylcysteine O-methyltransferase Ste14